MIRCGLPGTRMPCHDSASCKDDRCFGMVMADFDPGTAPIMGKTFLKKQTVDLIACLQKYKIGKGKPTCNECALYFDASADKACACLKGN